MKNSVNYIVALTMIVAGFLLAGCETPANPFSDPFFMTQARETVTHRALEIHRAEESAPEALPDAGSEKPVVIDLQMSILYAEFIRQTAHLSDGELKNFTLSIDRNMTTAELEILKDGEAQIIRRRWSVDDVDRYFRETKPKELRGKFSTPLVRDGKTRNLPGATYFRNALWACASAIEERQPVYVQIKIDFNPEGSIAGRAIVKDSNTVLNLSLNQRGKV